MCVRVYVCDDIDVSRSRTRTHIHSTHTYRYIGIDDGFPVLLLITADLFDQCGSVPSLSASMSLVRLQVLSHYQQRVLAQSEESV